jgi:hypothetical protein
MKTKITALLMLLSAYAFGQELDKPRKDRAFRSVITATKAERLSPRPKKKMFNSTKPFIEFSLVKFNEGQFFLRLGGAHDAGGLVIEKGQVAKVRFTDSTELALSAERRYAIHPSRLSGGGGQLGWGNDYQLNADAIATLKTKDIETIIVTASRTFIYPVDPEKKNMVAKALPVIGL